MPPPPPLNLTQLLKEQISIVEQLSSRSSPGKATPRAAVHRAEQFARLRLQREESIRGHNLKQAHARRMSATEMKRMSVTTGKLLPDGDPSSPIGRAADAEADAADDDDAATAAAAEESDSDADAGDADEGEGEAACSRARRPRDGRTRAAADG